MWDCDWERCLPTEGHSCHERSEEARGSPLTTVGWGEQREGWGSVLHDSLWRIWRKERRRWGWWETGGAFSLRLAMLILEYFCFSSQLDIMPSEANPRSRHWVSLAGALCRISWPALCLRRMWNTLDKQPNLTATHVKGVADLKTNPKL